MLPLTISVNAAGASLLKLATIPISIYFLFSLLFYKKPFRINIVHIVLCVYTVVTLVTVFVNPSRSNIEYIIGYFLNAALFICISIVEYNESELKLLEYVQIALLIIITAITFYNGTTVHGRATLSLFGQEYDPNYYVGFFIFPLTVTMKKIYTGKYRLVYIALALLAIYAVFSSGSRGGLLAILVTIAAFAIIYPKKRKEKLLVLLGMLLAVLFFWFAIRPFLSDTVVERMSISAVIETGGTNRTKVWASMINEMKNSSWEIVFGRGIQQYHRMTIDGKVYMAAAHNHIIQVMYDQGIIGLVAFALLVIVCIARCFKKRKCVAIALVGMMALSLSLSFNPSVKSFWNIIPYAAFVFSDAKIGDVEDKLS